VVQAQGRASHALRPLGPPAPTRRPRRPAPQASGGRWFPTAAITQAAGLSSLILPFALRAGLRVRHSQTAR
jgi:hypothetical protein